VQVATREGDVEYHRPQRQLSLHLWWGRDTSRGKQRDGKRLGDERVSVAFICILDEGIPTLRNPKSAFGSFPHYVQSEEEDPGHMVRGAGLRSPGVASMWGAQLVIGPHPEPEPLSFFLNPSLALSTELVARHFQGVQAADKCDAEMHVRSGNVAPRCIFPRSLLKGGAAASLYEPSRTSLFMYI